MRARAHSLISHFSLTSAVEQTAGSISPEPSHDSDSPCRLVAGGRDSERGGEEPAEEEAGPMWRVVHTHTHTRGVQGAMELLQGRPAAGRQCSSVAQHAATYRRTGVD